MLINTYALTKITIVITTVHHKTSVEHYCEVRISENYRKLFQIPTAYKKKGKKIAMA